MQADPTDPVPFLNAAFTDLQFTRTSARRSDAQLIVWPREEQVLLATAYFTWGAALMA